MVKKNTSRLSEEMVKKCFKRKILEDKFKEYSIQTKQRMELLLKVMGNPAISYSSGFPNEEERYEVILGTFLSGIWREDYFRLKARGKI